jgi:hypothetical protein
VPGKSTVSALIPAVWACLVQCRIYERGFIQSFREKVRGSFHTWFALLAACIMLVSCLAYFLMQEMEVIWSSETVAYTGLYPRRYNSLFKLCSFIEPKQKLLHCVGFVLFQDARQEMKYCGFAENKAYFLSTCPPYMLCALI